MSLFFDIKRYSINDGPGIRITLFMKGCPLRCVWCHNPEGLSVKKEKLYTKKKCIGCQSCVDICPGQALTLTPDGIVTDHDRCVLCGKCVDECPTLALEMSGTEYTPDYLIEQINKELPVIEQSGGGVTFCGGEPLMHPDTLLEMLKRCGTLGLHRCVDTTLFASESVVRRIMAETELFLIDLKHMDSEQHRKYTGVPNEQILSNIRMVAEAGKDFFIRIPLIVGVNADEENIRRSAEFLTSLPWERKTVNILAYHEVGKTKHDKLGSTYNPDQITMSAPDDAMLKRCVEIISSYGLKATIGG